MALAVVNHSHSLETVMSPLLFLFPSWGGHLMGRHRFDECSSLVLQCHNLIRRNGGGGSAVILLRYYVTLLIRLRKKSRNNFMLLDVVVFSLYFYSVYCLFLKKVCLELTVKFYGAPEGT